MNSRGRVVLPSGGDTVASVETAVTSAHIAGFLLGLAFGVVPAMVLDSHFGIGFTEPFTGVLEPATLWWALVPLALGVFFTFIGVWREVSVLSHHWQVEAFVPFVSGVLVFWLWVHGASAFLWPMVAFSVFYLFARTSRWTLTESVGPAIPRQAAKVSSGLLVSSAVPAGLVVQPKPQGPVLAPPPVPEPTYEFLGQFSGHTFADVLGMEREKAELLEFARDVRRGHRNGALLFGPPGSGKTFLVEALAGELCYPLVSVSIAQFASMFINETTQRVRAAFSSARSQVPCVLFFDELDSVMASRSAAGSDTEAARIVSALLTELVAIRGKNVLVLAATNFPERLDTAGRREGRFDVKIEIGLPDATTRRAILQERLKGYSLTEEVLEMACRHFAGVSIARLSAIAAQATKWLAAKPSRPVTFTLLLRALRHLQGIQLEQRFEAVPKLEGLALPFDTRRELETLAAMMGDIETNERRGGAVPLGAVFYGPSGTGKTLSAKALAKTTGWSFIPTTGHDLLRSDDAMDKVLERASDERPAIVFIDEADDILAERTTSPHTRTATNKLLTVLDGERGRVPDVFYIAATNHPAMLDSAARRRFPLKVAFDLPGPREIEQFVAAWLKERAVICAPNLTRRTAVRIFTGCSIAEVEIALQQAVNLAMATHTEARPCLRAADLARAVRSLSFH